MTVSRVAVRLNTHLNRTNRDLLGITYAANYMPRVDLHHTTVSETLRSFTVRA